MSVNLTTNTKKNIINFIKLDDKIKENKIDCVLFCFWCQLGENFLFLSIQIKKRNQVASLERCVSNHFSSPSRYLPVAVNIFVVII